MYASYTNKEMYKCTLKANIFTVWASEGTSASGMSRQQSLLRAGWQQNRRRLFIVPSGFLEVKGPWKFIDQGNFMSISLDSLG